MPIEERRFVPGPVRSEQAAKTKVLTGLAVRFNALSEDLGRFYERIAPGAFDASLAGNGNLRMLADHDASKILGSRSNKSLTLWADTVGLRFRCELPDTSAANDVYELCRRGDLGEMSFGFRCLDETWSDEPSPEDRKQKVSVRTVRAADLFEISAVTWPAYANGATHVSAELAGRNLFPGGAIPLEIRSRFPELTLTTEELLLRAKAKHWLERLALERR